MADKLFFKGRQDSRINHVTSGYSTNAYIKAGTKEQPLNLTVTTEARQEEVALQVTEAELFAEITLDKNEGAVESINELTILLNKTETVVLGDVPGRNDPCSCGSGKKYKKCCG